MRISGDDHAQEQRECQRPQGGFKKFVQQGHIHFDARSVPSVREHGTMARTPLDDLFEHSHRKLSLNSSWSNAGLFQGMLNRPYVVFFL
jgi:hypothetical protein